MKRLLLPLLAVLALCGFRPPRCPRAWIPARST